MAVGFGTGMSSDWALSALKWWEDAGVDVIVGETARDWLNPAAKAPAPRPEAQVRADRLPDGLADFRQWLLATDRLPVPPSSRVPAAGDPESGLMILVDMPSTEDLAASALLAGAPGILFDRMIKAIGRSRETVYLASLSPARTASGKLDADAARGLAEIARHHVGLVLPKALLLFGDACAKALLGPAVAGARGRWHDLETPRGTVRTIATFSPHYLERLPTAKKLAWEDLQMLMEGLKP